MKNDKKIVGVDLFCGAGGLSYGLRSAGISICAGFDLDATCDYPFVENIGAPFFKQDIREITSETLEPLYPKDCVRLLAGCALCSPVP